jgi:hypothetical protein
VLKKVSSSSANVRAAIYQSFADLPPELGKAALLAGEAEGWDFYRSVEGVPPPGFRLGVIAAFEGDRPLAVAPMFRIGYRLDTPLQGRLRRVGDWLHRNVPRVVTFPVIGIGSPMSDNCGIGFCPSLGTEERRETVRAMLRELHREARARGDWVLAVKSLGPEGAEEFHGCLEDAGYMRVTSVPVVKLRLPFRSLEAYFASLPRKTASYFRRKLRPASELRIEYRSTVEGLEGQLNALFESTLEQSRVDHGDFEQLDPAYFGKVVSGLGENAKLMLCWRGDELLSFQLFLVGREQIIAKQIGMKYPEAREYNLYFVNWIELIRFALEKRIPLVEMGATTYATKLLFGGYLERRWLYFRARDDWANPIYRRLSARFDFEGNDPELKELKTPMPK